MYSLIFLFCLSNVQYSVILTQVDILPLVLTGLSDILLAHLIEHLTLNLEVLGSNPDGGRHSPFT